MRKRNYYILLFCIFIPLTSYGKSIIKQIKLFNKDDTLNVSLISNIELNSTIDQTIKNGFPIRFSYEFEVKKEKWHSIGYFAKIKKNYILSYQHITSEYLLTNPVTFEIRYFKKLSNVIKSLNYLNSFPLLPIKQLPDEKSVLKVRFHLNTESLPLLIRLDNLVNSNLKIDSDWITWPIL